MLSKEKQDEKQRFGIRKLSIGVASVVLSSVVVMVNTNNKAYADEMPSSTAHSSNNSSEETIKNKVVVLNDTKSNEQTVNNTKKQNANLVLAATNTGDAGVSDSDAQSVPVGGNKSFVPIKNADKLTDGVVKINESTDTWNLKGLGNYDYGTIKYNANDKKLTVSGNGNAPHVYYNSNIYSSINVSRNNSIIYQHEYIGNQGSSFNHEETLQVNDTISIFQDEFGRIKTSSDDLKFTNLNSPKTYIFSVDSDGKLKNITDYTNIKNNVNSMFSSSDQNTLALGLTIDAVKQVENTINNNKCLTDEQRKELTDEAQKAEKIITTRPEGLKANETKIVDIFSVKPNDATNNEGRPMGNNMDRQDLGISMTQGAKVKFKITQSSDPNATLTLDLIDSSSQNEQVVNLKANNNDWVEVTANANNVPYVKTPGSGTYKVEYQIVSGRVDELPVFSHSSNQVEVQSKWDKTKSPYALMKSYNFQLQIPYLDIVNVANTNMQSLLDQYDNQLFKLYAQLTGIDYNTSDTPKVRRYFAMPDINGIGAAYYNSGKWIAINGSSVASYLGIGWLTLHEIAHGYEIPSSTMDIVDNFNNVYGTIYQSIYTYPDLDSFNKDTWVYGGNHKDLNINNLIKQVVTEHKTFNQLGLGDRLIELLSLADYKGIDSWTVFNKYHQMLANSGQNANDLGKDWVQAFEKEYHVDLTPYFDFIGVPIDQITATNMANESLTPLAPLFQLVSDGKIKDVIKQLWGDKDHLKNQWSLVSADDLAATGLRSSVNLTINEGQGHTFILKNGSKIVKTISIPQGAANSYQILLNDLPIGIYTLVGSEPGMMINNPYIYVAEGKTNNATATLSDNILNVIHDLYTDNTFTKLKSTATVRQADEANNLINQIKDNDIKAVNKDLVNKAYSLLEQVTLLGGSDVIFGTINDNNGDGTLTVRTYPVQPHWAFGNSIYATIKIYDNTGKLVWSKDIKASDTQPNKTDVYTNAEGYRIVVTHVEGSARLRASLGNETITPGNSQEWVVKNGRLESKNPSLKLNSKTAVSIEANQISSYDDLIKQISPTVTPNNANAKFSICSGSVDFEKAGTYSVVLLASVNGKELRTPITVTVTGNVPCSEEYYLYDDTEGKVVTSGTVSGKNGESVDFSSANKQLADLLNKGYALAPAKNMDVTDGKFSPATFNYKNSTGHRFVVNLIHTYKDVVQRKNVQRTIDYKYAGGEKNGIPAAPTVVQTVTLSRNAVIDNVTGKEVASGIVNGQEKKTTQWETVSSQNDWPSVNSPSVPGYTASNKTIPAVHVNGADSSVIEHVLYESPKQAAASHVNGAGQSKSGSISRSGGRSANGSRVYSNASSVAGNANSQKASNSASKGRGANNAKASNALPQAGAKANGILSALGLAVAAVGGLLGLGISKKKREK